MYFLMALLDLEGSYFTFLAFRYTTLTSVSLLDAIAIPSAMFFSRFLLKRCYQFPHFLGALICIVGVSINILGDFEGGNNYYADAQEDDGNNGNGNGNDDGQIDNEFPYPIRGDMLAVVGAILYGLNDVLTERSVKDIGGIKEYLAMMGIFGMIVSTIQGFMTDRDEIVEFFTRESDLCSASKGFSLLLLQAVFGVLSFVGISYFLMESEAALLNLSLLTGDLWAVAFTVIAQQIIPSPMFWVALLLIFLGVFIYELSSSPILDEVDYGSDDDMSLDFGRNRLIQQRHDDVTTQHLQELEMPDDEII